MHPYAVAPSPGSSVPSPTTTASPQALTPATSSIMNKPLAPMPGSGNIPPISINKHWVLPPKPRPGRKPALDTPPTKRKAQNREAQRAFRERRAAKVGELEEEMKKMEGEDRREQEGLRVRIERLESEVEEYSRMVVTWSERCREMEMACARETQLRRNAEMEMEILRKGMMNDTEAVALPPRRAAQTRYVEEQPTKGEEDHVSGEEYADGCGNCSKDTRCACVEDAFEMAGMAPEHPTSSTFKRPHSPQSVSNNKRARQNSNFNDGLEIDFTAQFATPRRPSLTTAASSSSIPAMASLDPCGFCVSGGICICAELSKDNDLKPPPSLFSTPNQAPAIGIVESGPCVNGPGTCAQCLSDPTSESFCKSVAATRLPTLDNAGHANGAMPFPMLQTDSISEDTIPCAEAFRTLSRHPGFEQATSEMSTWIPRLAAARKPASRPDRTAYDIEAASVMSVLKYFDRRFAPQKAQAAQMNGASSTGQSGIILPTRSTGAVIDAEPQSWIAYEPSRPSGK